MRKIETIKDFNFFGWGLFLAPPLIPGRINLAIGWWITTG
jgi:hypothetical protein